MRHCLTHANVPDRKHLACLLRGAPAPRRTYLLFVICYWNVQGPCALICATMPNRFEFPSWSYWYWYIGRLQHPFWNQGAMRGIDSCPGPIPDACPDARSNNLTERGKQSAGKLHWQSWGDRSNLIFLAWTLVPISIPVNDIDVEQPKEIKCRRTCGWQFQTMLCERTL